MTKHEENMKEYEEKHGKCGDICEKYEGISPTMQAPGFRKILSSPPLYRL